jgi:hypothetical protein
LDKIDKCNNEIIAVIVDVLDLGGKFVPNGNNNIIDSLCEVIQQSERDISTLNSKIFFEKQKLKKSNQLTYNHHLDQPMPVISLKINILENLKQKLPFDNSKIYAQFETMNLFC